MLAFNAIYNNSKLSNDDKRRQASRAVSELIDAIYNNQLGMLSKENNDYQLYCDTLELQYCLAIEELKKIFRVTSPVSCSPFERQTPKICGLLQDEFSDILIQAQNFISRLNADKAGITYLHKPVPKKFEGQTTYERARFFSKIEAFDPQIPNAPSKINK